MVTILGKKTDRNMKCCTEWMRMSPGEIREPAQQSSFMKTQNTWLYLTLYWVMHKLQNTSNTFVERIQNNKKVNYCSMNIARQTRTQTTNSINGHALITCTYAKC